MTSWFSSTPLWVIQPGSDSSLNAVFSMQAALMSCATHQPYPELEVRERTSARFFPASALRPVLDCDAARFDLPANRIRLREVAFRAGFLPGNQTLIDPRGQLGVRSRIIGDHIQDRIDSREYLTRPLERLFVQSISVELGVRLPYEGEER